MQCLTLLMRVTTKSRQNRPDSLPSSKRALESDGLEPTSERRGDDSGTSVSVLILSSPAIRSAQVDAAMLSCDVSEAGATTVDGSRTTNTYGTLAATAPRVILQQVSVTTPESESIRLRAVHAAADIANS